MNRNAIKIKIGAIIIFALVLLFTTRLVGHAGTVKSLIAPPELDLLGAGFNSLNKKFIYDNKCLKYNTDIETEMQGVISDTAYYFVNSKKELEDKFLYNFAANPGITPDMTAKSRVTEMIVNKTSFSADKITIIAYWKQEDLKIYSNDLPTMADEGVTILKTNPKRFFELYGDKYVNSVTLGKIFFIVYQADIANFSSYSSRTKTAIKRAMELNLKKIQGSKLSPQELAFAGERLEDVNISSTTYGTDITDLAGPYSVDDYKAMIKKVATSPSEVIASELKNYSYTYKRSEDAFYNISDYLKMAEQWNRHLSYFDYIVTNLKLSFDLLTECRFTIDKINNQLKMVYALETDARIPSTKETNSFNNLYNRYVTEMKISPRTYTLPSPDEQADKHSDKQLELDLSNINDVESIKIDCQIQTKRNVFGGFNRRPTIVTLNIVDEDGNISEVTSTPVYKFETVTLYEGIKICDKFKITFPDPENRPSPWTINSKTSEHNSPGSKNFGSKIPDIKITCSYTEKVYDIIWILLHNKATK